MFVSRARVYWVQLFRFIRILCRYYNKYKDKLPADLPDRVKTALTAVDLACEVLADYDAAHPGGEV